MPERLPSPERPRPKAPDRTPDKPVRPLSVSEELADVDFSEDLRRWILHYVQEHGTSLRRTILDEDLEDHAAVGEELTMKRLLEHMVETFLERNGGFVDAKAPLRRIQLDALHEVLLQAHEFDDRREPSPQEKRKLAVALEWLKAREGTAEQERAPQPPSASDRPAANQRRPQSPAAAPPRDEDFRHWKY